MMYVAEFGKVRNDIGEFEARMANFATVDAFIKEHNSESSHTHTAGHNQFSDWTDAEYKAMLGHLSDDEDTVPTPTLLDTSSNADSINWVEAGAVTSVKD